MQDNQITVQTVVHVPVEKAWEYWTTPQHILEWNAASDDWHTTDAANDLRVGGTFSSRMEAKDKSTGFDFNGTYTEVVPHERIAYTMEDGRKVEITFEKTDDGVKIVETFEMEHENPREMQQAGWQSILDRFKAYAERA
jgi:uncharacterized protein YndB with AHSA1/START domain